MAGAPVMFQMLVHGVKRFCASKSAAGSGSSSSAGGSGGWASVGVRMTSKSAHAAAIRLPSCCMAASAPAYSTPVTARPISRSQRVRGFSRSSASGGSGTWAAPVLHSGMKAIQSSPVIGRGATSMPWPDSSSSRAAPATAASASGWTGASSVFRGSISTPTRSGFTAASHAWRNDDAGASTRCTSPGRGRAITSRRAAESRTVRVRTPSVTSPIPSLRCGPGETRPREGFIPTTPQHAAGMRREPPPSDPWAAGTTPAATAAAAPPEEPPAVRVRSHGVRAGAPVAGSV